MKMMVVVVMVVVLIFGSELFCYLSVVLSEVEEFVLVYNVVRVDVDVGFLVWSYKLEDYVCKYGEEQCDYYNCVMVYLWGLYGENFFWGYGKLFVFVDVVCLWVDEKQYYDYDLNFCVLGKVCGYYMQVVWVDIKEVGCVLIICYDKVMFIICSYNLFGNFVGEWLYKCVGIKYLYR